MRVRIPRFFWTLILAGLVGFSLSGCLTREEYSQEDIQALIDAEVEKKIEQFTSTKLERCREELIAEASQMADSILIDEAYFERDTLLRPGKPEKPEKPVIKILKDTTALRPLFDPRKVAENERDTTGK